MATRQAESSKRLNGFVVGGIVAESGDAELLSRFTAERDEGAFAALVRRHGPMVFRVCRQIVGDRHTAEDAFQATFLILARRAGSIRGPELLGHWLHGVAFRTAREARMRRYRRQRRECAIAGAGPAEPVDRSGRPDLELRLSRGIRGAPRRGFTPSRTLPRAAGAVRSRGVDLSRRGAARWAARSERLACGCGGRGNGCEREWRDAGWCPRRACWLVCWRPRPGRLAARRRCWSIPRSRRRWGSRARR